MSSQQVLPHPIASLVKAQNDHDSTAFSALFADDSIVRDEGKVYHGTVEIEKWNQATTEKYRATLEPIGYQANEEGGVLTVRVTGNFPGSPISLNYSLTYVAEKIRTLSIGG